MRSSVVSFALAAGVLALLVFGAGAVRADGCCLVAEGDKAAASDEGRAEAVAAAAPPVNAAPAPTPLALSSEAVLDRSSYEDVFRILKAGNSCSDFFGGPRLAVTVFNQLTLQLRKRPIGERAVAIRMSGSYTNYQDMMTGAMYRLFEDAAVNSAGPFAAPSVAREANYKRVGRFTIETRQARALILLHELGHLLRGKDGKWLLPDDGNRPDLSESNTRKVESHCISQLFELGG